MTMSRDVHIYQPPTLLFPAIGIMFNWGRDGVLYYMTKFIVQF